jgi:hypothetical protein
MRQSGNVIAAQDRSAKEPGSDRANRALPLRPRTRDVGDRAQGRNWLFEPKTAIWVVLAATLLVGAGRKLRSNWRARRALALLARPDVTPGEIEAAAEYGRTGAWELLRVFSAAGTTKENQYAAGWALARLWLKDELVAEEEQAIVRRGFTVNWKARRRYPRALESPIPIGVTYLVPFLRDDGRAVGPSNLEWSHRVLGARRAALEEFSPWTSGPGQIAFAIVPGDFESHGPHRLVLQARVRTTGLSGRWEIELPHIPFNFEFDPILQLDSILTHPDAGRAELMTHALRLEPDAPADLEQPRYLSLGTEWALRNPPVLDVATSLPCDLAHAISIELEGSSGQFPAGQVVATAQARPRTDSVDFRSTPRRFKLGPVTGFPDDAIQRPGLRRLRLVLDADAASGWADPDIRSVWPGRIETEWIDVEIVRR